MCVFMHVRVRRVINAGCTFELEKRDSRMQIPHLVLFTSKH